MPLDKSGSNASVGSNIKTEMAAGKPQRQAVAIALHTQDQAKKRKSPARTMYPKHRSEEDGEHEHRG